MLLEQLPVGSGGYRLHDRVVDAHDEVERLAERDLGSCCTRRFERAREVLGKPRMVSVSPLEPSLPTTPSRLAVTAVVWS